MGRRRTPRTLQHDAPVSSAAPSAPSRGSISIVVGLLVVFGLLEVFSFPQRSATWDEPTHLAAGYAALSRDFRVDPSHPPLARMWAALPLLMTGEPRVETRAIDIVPPNQWLTRGGPAELGRAYLYDGRQGSDRRLNRARAMIVALGLVAGWMLWRWAYEWQGTSVAACTLAAFVLSPQMTAHAGLVTTDFAETATFAASMFFLWRWSRGASVRAATLLAVAIAAAILAKFSGLVLLPIVAGLMLLFVSQRRVTWRDAIRAVAIIGAVGVVAIWLVYGLRYLPSDAPVWAFDISRHHAAAPLMTAIFSWIDAHHLLPNAFSEGVVFASVASQQPAYLLGQYSTAGWWYYFPVAILVKTPEPLLILVVLGLVYWLKERTAGQLVDRACVLVPTVVYGAVAIASGINIGLRHLLPVYPFLILIAGTAAGRLLVTPSRWAKPALAVMCVVWVAGRAATFPHSLTYFNLVSGGPSNGLKYLADSNLDWGQHLKLLKSWMDRQRVTHVNLAYFGQASPEYYGIRCTYLPSTILAAPKVSKPILPGYVAISATILSGVYLEPEWRLFYSGFIDRRPDASIGNSIKVFWVEHWPEPATSSVAANTEALLADTLLTRLRWPEHAATHYERYLKARPTDPSALSNLGAALYQAGRPQEALPVFRKATALAPTDVGLRGNLVAALIEQGEIEAATVEAQSTAEAMPDRAEAHLLAGRAWAARGDLRRARRAYERALAINPLLPGAEEALRSLREVPRGLSSGR